MKRLLSLIIVAVMMLTLVVGCGKKEETTTETPVAETPATETPATETPATETPATTDSADVVTTASVTNDVETLVAALSKDGTWIAASLNDMSYDKEIVVEGEFTNRDVIDRKLALYTQDEDRNITAQFTLTAPKLIVKSENFRIQGGTFKGDVYVEAKGFKIDKAGTVDGNIYFASKELMDTFTVTDSSKITGTIAVDGVDVVATASLVVDANDLVKALSKDGTWIGSTLFNMVLSQEIIVEGEFTNRDQVARKLALYTQDADRNVTASFTVAAPSMTVKSENFSITNGTFKGDVYVEAAGFKLINSTVDGNIYYATQALMDGASLDATSKVTGVSEVKAK